ncbi:MAG: TetR/AcrR family transcriptional regulator, partial [Actinomycetota bacterium]|nr:TetR/AcrR family transcriptional regulator [Actinomycetota bacterium]
MPDHRSRPAKAALITGVSAGRTRPDQIRGGSHGLTPEQVASSQRERVLAAMRELVAGRGYQAVPVTEVIRHAGVSRKTFYELWPGKEECFVAVYEREMERLLAPTLQAFEGDEPWPDRLRTALGVLLGALAADADAARICFV